MSSPLDDLLKKFDETYKPVAQQRPIPVTPMAPPVAVAPPPMMPAASPFGWMDEPVVEEQGNPFAWMDAPLGSDSSPQESAQGGQAAGAAPLVAPGLERLPAGQNEAPALEASSPGFFDTVKNLGRATAQGFNEQQAAVQLNRGSMLIKTPEEAAEGVARNMREAQLYPQDPEYKNAVLRGALKGLETPGLLNKIGKMFTDKDFALYVGDTIARSLPASVPSAALGVVGTIGAGPIGTAAGIAAGSGESEYISVLFETLRESGVDPLDEEQVAAALQNDKLLGKARTKAFKRGLSVGVADGVFGFFGGKLGGAVARGMGPGRLARPAAVAGTGLTTETVGAGVGEIGAQLWTEGQVDMHAVEMEMIGESVVGMGEFGASYLSEMRGAPTLRLSPVTAEDIDVLAGGPETPEVPVERMVETEEAEAEGRTLYGFDTGEGSVKVGTYEEAEAQAGLKGARAGKIIAVKPEEAIAPEVKSIEEAVAVVPREVAATISKRGSAFEGGSEATDRMAWAVRDYHDAQTDEQRQSARERFDQALLEGAKVKTTPTFTGPTASLGVRYRTPDYAGLNVKMGGSNVVEGGLLIADPAGTESEMDLDLKKINSPNVLKPTASSFEQFYDGYGEEATREILVKGGTAPELVEKVISDLRGGNTIYLYEPGIRVHPDPRVFQGGAIVLPTPEAAAAAKAALVPRPKGISKRRLDSVGTFASLGFRRKSGTPGGAAIANGADLVKFPIEIAEAFSASVVLMETLIKKYKLPFDLQVGAYSRATPINPKVARNVQGSAGYFIPTDHFGQRSTYSIVLNLENITSPSELYRVAAHEFGHYLAATGFIQQSPENRTAIMAAYRRYTLGAKVGTSAEVASRFGALDRAAGNLASDNEYQHSFDEWWAEQVARWATTGRRPVGFIAKIAKPIAIKLRESFRLFVGLDPIARLRAEPEVEQLLNSFGRFSKAEWGPFMEDAHNQETLLANQKAMRGEDIGQPTPMTPQTVNMRKLFKKIDPESLIQYSLSTGNAPPSLPRIEAQADRFNWMYKWFLHLGQVAQQNPTITELQQYRELVQLAHVEQTKIHVAAHERMREWSAIGKEQAQALGQALFGLTQMNYRTDQEVLDGVVRNPTRAEVEKIVADYGLSSEATRLLGSIRQDFTTALDRYIDQLNGEARSITNPEARQQRLTDIQNMRKAMTSRPYFPMMRHGKWALEVRENGRLVHFETFESKRAQQSAFRRARALWPADATVSARALEPSSVAFLGVPPQMIESMATHLELNPKQRADLEQLKFQLSPTQSFKKRFMTRNEVAGFSEDAQRAYAHYFFHHAKHFMRVKYRPLLQERINGLETLAKMNPGPDTYKLDRLRKYLDDHLNEFLNPKADAAALRSFVAVWYLGFVPASAVLNLTQLGFATAPFLSAKFGDLKTLNTMRKEAVALRQMYSQAGGLKMSAEKQRAVNRAVEEGFITESQGAELAALSEASNLAGVGDRVAGSWRFISEWSMKMFGVAEGYNRRVTFRTAWELAMANPEVQYLKDLQQKHPLQYDRLINEGWPPVEALAFIAGKDAVEETQFEYARHARPRFMQGRKGAIFMFFLFTQNMLFMLGKNRGTILPRYLLTMMVMGGMMGLPGMEDAEDILKMMARMFGKDFDVERSVTKLVSEVLGDDFPTDMVLRGVARRGMGIGAGAEMAAVALDMPGLTVVPSIDFSRAIGMGRVMPFNPARMLAEPGKSFEESFTKGVQENAGAAFGVGFNFAKALSDTMNYGWDLKTWERAMPRSMKSATRAARTMIEGGETLRNGGEIIDFPPDDPRSWGEAAAMAGGFTPTRVSQTWDQFMQIKDVEAHWESKRAYILDQIADARLSKDPERRKAALDRMREFNSEAREAKLPGYLITRETRERSWAARKRTMGITEDMSSHTRGGKQVARQMRELFEVDKPRRLDQLGR